jgi:hypothetical protein
LGKGEKIMGIILTVKGRLGEDFKVILDKEDYTMFKSELWRIEYGVNTCYVKLAGVKRKCLHHMVMGVEPCKEIHVHHVNKDGLDNRKSNLRLMTSSAHGTLHGKEK